MRVVVLLLLCLSIAGCQTGPEAAPSRGQPTAAGEPTATGKPTIPTDDRSVWREKFGGVCSPYASNCW